MVIKVSELQSQKSVDQFQVVAPIGRGLSTLNVDATHSALEEI